MIVSLIKETENFYSCKFGSQHESSFKYVYVSVEHFFILACIFSLLSLSGINPLCLSALGNWETECGEPAGFGVIWRWGPMHTEKLNVSTFPNLCLHTRPFMSTNRKQHSALVEALLCFSDVLLEFIIPHLLPVLSVTALLLLFATIIYEKTAILFNTSCECVYLTCKKAAYLFLAVKYF